MKLITLNKWKKKDMPNHILKNSKISMHQTSTWPFIWTYQIFKNCTFLISSLSTTNKILLSLFMGSKWGLMTIWAKSSTNSLLEKWILFLGTKQTENTMLFFLTLHRKTKPPLISSKTSLKGFLPSIFLSLTKFFMFTLTFLQSPLQWLTSLLGPSFFTSILNSFKMLKIFSKFLS